MFIRKPPTSSCSNTCSCTVSRRKNIGGGVTTDDKGNTHAGKYTPFSWTGLPADRGRHQAIRRSGNACVIKHHQWWTPNVAFFKEIVAAGLTPTSCPVVSFSLAEDEFRSLSAKDLVGELGCWTYFMSIPTPENQAFLKKWSDWLASPKLSGRRKGKPRGR